MPNYEIIAQLRAWANDLENEVLLSVARPAAVAHVAVIILGLRRTADDLERESR